MECCCSRAFLIPISILAKGWENEAQPSASTNQGLPTRPEHENKVTNGVHQGKHNIDYALTKKPTR